MWICLNQQISLLPYLPVYRFYLSTMSWVFHTCTQKSPVCILYGPLCISVLFPTTLLHITHIWVNLKRLCLIVYIKIKYHATSTLHMPYKPKLFNQEMGSPGCLMLWSAVPALHHPPRLSGEMWDFPCKMLGWMKHKLETRLPREISITSDMQITPLLWQKAKKN